MARLSGGQKAVIAIAILVIIGLLGGVLYLSGVADKLFHKSKPVSFAFAVKVDKGLDEHATPVIAHIQGVDASNKHIDVYKVLSFESNTSVPSSQDAPASGSDSPEAAGMSTSETAALSFEEIDRNPGAYAISYISPINPDGSLYEVSEPQTIDTNTAQPMVTAEATMTYRAPETVTDEELGAVISEIEKATHVSGEQAQTAELQMVLDQAQQVSTNKQVMAEALKEASDKHLQALSGTVKIVHNDDEYYALLGEEKPEYTPDSKIGGHKSNTAILVLDQQVDRIQSHASAAKRIRAVELGFYPTFFSEYEGKEIIAFIDQKKMEEMKDYSWPLCVPSLVVVKEDRYQKVVPTSDLPCGSYSFQSKDGHMSHHMIHTQVTIDDTGTIVSSYFEMRRDGMYCDEHVAQISLDTTVDQKQGCQSYKISGDNEGNVLNSDIWYYNPSDKTFTTNSRDSFVLKLAE